MRRAAGWLWACAVSAFALCAVAAWTLWNLRSICRACAEEERDARLLARDGGAA